MITSKMVANVRIEFNCRVCNRTCREYVEDFPNYCNDSPVDMTVVCSNCEKDQSHPDGTLAGFRIIILKVKP